jgi:hypothetical protein
MHRRLGDTPPPHTCEGEGGGGGVPAPPARGVVLKVVQAVLKHALLPRARARAHCPPLRARGHAMASYQQSMGLYLPASPRLLPGFHSLFLALLDRIPPQTEVCIVVF